MASLTTMAVAQPVAVKGLGGSSLHGTKLSVRSPRRVAARSNIRSAGAVVAKYGDKSVYFDLEDLGNTTGQWDLYGSDAPSPYNPLQTGNVKETNQIYNLPVDGPRRQAEKNSTPYNRECSSKESKSFCEVMVKRSKCNRSSRSPEESQFPCNKSNIKKSTKVELDVQLLLLSDQSFISHAQDLFRLKAYQTTDNQSRGILKRGTRNVELVLDCAKELMIRKRYQAEIANHHMLQTSLWSLSVAVSLDQLVNEISNGIEKLNGYSKNVAGVSMKDGIYVRLEGDLRCRDVMLDAMWDVGWLNRVCVEEADHAVGQVEELILCGLVEEMVVELVC